MLNICMITPEFPPNSFGVGYYVYNLSIKLKDLGNDVSVITRGAFKKVKVDDFRGIRIYRVRFFPLPPLHVKIHGLFLNNFLKGERLKFDIVNYHNAAVPQLKINSSSVVTFHSCWKAQTKIYTRVTDFHSLYVRMLGNFLAKNEANLLNKVDKVTAVSYKIANDLSFHYGIDASKIDIMRNGVDTNFFTPPNSRVKREKFSILYVGRLVHLKGLIDLVKSAKYVCKECPNVSFTLIGNGALRPVLEKIVHKSGLKNNFLFLGFATRRKELVKHYQRNSIFVLPSYYEGMPTSILEAMSCKMPIVATNIPGINEIIVNGETGLLVPPRNPEKLANAIITLLNDNKLRKRMGNAGREKVEREFSWKEIAKKVIEIYTNILN